MLLLNFFKCNSSLQTKFHWPPLRCCGSRNLRDRYLKTSPNKTCLSAWLDTTKVKWALCYCSAANNFIIQCCDASTDQLIHKQLQNVCDYTVHGHIYSGLWGLLMDSFPATVSVCLLTGGRSGWHRGKTLGSSILARKKEITWSSMRVKLS